MKKVIIAIAVIIVIMVAVKFVPTAVIPARQPLTGDVVRQIPAEGKAPVHAASDSSSSEKRGTSGTRTAAIKSTVSETARAKSAPDAVMATSERRLDSPQSALAARAAISVTVTPANPSVGIGMTRQFSATGVFRDKTSRDITHFVKWKSSNAKVAAIDSAGLVTAGSKAGTATITASIGDKAGSTNLTITGHALVSITVTPAAPSLGKGTTRQLIATGNYLDNTTENITSVAAWTSSDAMVASISPAGVASAEQKAGTAKITALFGGRSGSTLLTVEPALVSLSVTPATASVRQMITLKFTATAAYDDGSTRDVTMSSAWTVKVPAVAGINEKGLATAIGIGASPILAVYGGVTGSAMLNVSIREMNRPEARGSAGLPAGERGTANSFVLWPAPRFTMRSNSIPVLGGVVIDQLTGFMWTADAKTPGPADCEPAVAKTWQGSHDYIACLNRNKYLGYSDWRLPGTKELFSLADYLQTIPSRWVYTEGFSYVQYFHGYDYWLSSVQDAYRKFADLSRGVVYTCNEAHAFHVWPMRVEKTVLSGSRSGEAPTLTGRR